MAKITNLGVVLLLLQIFVACVLSQEDQSTLRLVHVFFRHGDRTTDTSTLYPRDPHINETYFPYGLGELTKKGKQTAYKVGKLLRLRYDDFLGRLYTPDILDARASPYNRTISTLELVLAGLFPPSQEEMIPGLNWQPIPYYHSPKNQDKIFLAIDNCPNFQKHLDRYTQSPKMLEEFNIYRGIFEYVRRSTGRKINNYFDLMLIHASLKSEEEWGLTLPRWARKVYPKLLESFSIKSFELLTGTTEMKRLMSGYLLKKIVEDSIAKIDGTMRPRNKKIFLYGGHEFNIACILNTLGVFKKHIPPYGAHLMIELHEIDDVFGIKIYYQNWSTNTPQLLKLPACDEFCPLEQFILLVEEYFPEDGTCGNPQDCVPY